MVHGPLIATLLLDLVRRERPGSRIDAFCFRAMAPLFDGRRMAVNGATPDAHGNVSLWAENAEGGLAMKAEARIG